MDARDALEFIIAGATAVRFNGTAAAYTVASETQLTATVPAGATSGPLSVTTPGGTATSTASFTVFQAPTVSSFTPASGGVGTSVTITGTNLTGATAVRFNGTGASFTVKSARQIVATVPAGATSGSVSVTTPGGIATSAASFTVIGAPTISSFTPASGKTGTSVTISGTNLAGATSVAFNGTKASFTVSSGAVIATVPKASAADVDRAVAAEFLPRVARRLGTTSAEIAIAWVLRQPRVTSAIVGARRPGQLAETIGGGRLKLASADLAEIEALLKD